MSGLSPEELRRAWFHSRRGMLELDVLLIPFTEEALPSLPPDVQQQYLELLDSEDQTLFQWLTGKGSPSSARLREMVEKVLAHNASKGPSGSG